jgi:hypothetical protein
MSRFTIVLCALAMAALCGCAGMYVAGDAGAGNSATDHRGAPR